MAFQGVKHEAQGLQSHSPQKDGIVLLAKNYGGGALLTIEAKQKVTEGARGISAIRLHAVVVASQA